MLQGFARLPYSRLPGFPAPAVAGHPGHAYVGNLGTTPVILLAGRAHYYEGHSMTEVTFAIRVLEACGIQDVLLTNAAGGIKSRLRPGDFMVVTDHINFMGANPLRSAPEPDRPGFVDLSATYDAGLRRLLIKAGKRCGLRLHQGVFLAVSGPSYETPAEIRAFGKLGADAVGMSTVPEAIVARQLGLRVAGLSCITNLAAGRNPVPLSHSEVLQTARHVQVEGFALLTEFARSYAEGGPAKGYP
jgi:purine-nucleoside phosphorylase